MLSYVESSACVYSQNDKTTNERKQRDGSEDQRKGGGFSFFFFSLFLFFLFAFVFVKGVTRLDFYRRWARFAVVLFLSDYATFDTCSNYRMKDESLIALAFVVSIRGKVGWLCVGWGVYVRVCLSSSGK